MFLLIQDLFHKKFTSPRLFLIVKEKFYLRFSIQILRIVLMLRILILVFRFSAYIHTYIYYFLVLFLTHHRYSF